ATRGHGPADGGAGGALTRPLVPLTRPPVPAAGLDPQPAAGPAGIGPARAPGPDPAGRGRPRNPVPAGVPPPVPPGDWFHPRTRAGDCQQAPRPGLAAAARDPRRGRLDGVPGMKDLPISANVSAETLVGQVADEFLERLDRGEQPTIEEYAQRYP